MSTRSQDVRRKLGVLVVGLNGATASTTVAGSTAMKLGLIPTQYGTTDALPFSDLGLIGIEDVVFGGWDITSHSVWDAVLKHGILPEQLLTSSLLSSNLDHMLPAPGLMTPLDIPPESGHDNIQSCERLAEAIASVTNKIENFRQSESLSCVIVVYLGSPGKRATKPLSELSLPEFEQLLMCDSISDIPSGLIYALASINAGAHFVDFTPSETLEVPIIDSLATQKGVQIAGRDGSTGQTMLKASIAHLFKIRNLRVKSWFSTNIIGNHDGYVLDLPGHDTTKLHDKTSVLDSLLGYSDFEHLVTIHYFQARGDEKEAWDVVDFTGWMGAKMSLRINWQGEDSALAAPLILDLVRLIEYGSLFGLKGLQPQLALYFKYPLPYQPARKGVIDQYHDVVDFYSRLTEGDRDTSRP